MGNGTTMGWMGWRKMETAVGVPRGRGCPSFFMVASLKCPHEAMRSMEQPSCRSRSLSRVQGTATLAALPLLAGCMETPLSTLAPASEVTRSVATLWWVMATGTGVVLLLMIVLATLAVRRHPPRAPGRRGILVLLIAGGLMLPAATITALLAYSLRLDEAQWPAFTGSEAREAFHVDVVAHRWWWEFRYPQADAEARTVNEVHVPAGVPVHLRLTSADVIHAFWVPRVAGKLDAVPGKVNRLRIQVDEPGRYAGVCAEFCGEGHAHMPFTLIAHEAGEMASVLANIREGRP